jgi:uncharacterized membrane protein HdeD (DUF308 family)
LDDQVLDHRIIEMAEKPGVDSCRNMDLAGKLEKTFNIPRLALALLAIIFGILVLVLPYILNVIVALFLIVWGIMEAIVAMGKTTKQ